MKEQPGLKRGEFARRSGVNPETLRFYERKGLLPAPQRSRHNYRLYAPSDLKRVRFIKRAQSLGFSLEEIRELLALRSRKGLPCADVESRARAKLRDISTKLAQLNEMKSVLTTLVEQCQSNDASSDCPILDSLDSEAEAPD